MGTILLNDADYTMVQQYIGVARGMSGLATLSLAEIQTDVFLGDAEATVIDQVAQQIAKGNPVASVATIMARSVTDKDRIELRNAVISYTAYKYANSLKFNFSTSLGDDGQSDDIGGVGAEWREIKKQYLRDYDTALVKITGWNKWRKIPIIT